MKKMTLEELEVVSLVLGKVLLSLEAIDDCFCTTEDLIIRLNAKDKNSLSDVCRKISKILHD